MSFDGNSIIASMFISGIGFVLFKYGRGQQRMPQAVIGVIMMVYPYVVTNVVWMIGVAVGLLTLMASAIFLGL